MRYYPEQRKRTNGRFVSYLKFLFHLFVLGIFLFGVLALVQELWHPFDTVLERSLLELATIDRTLATESVAGVSLGALVLAVAVAGASLFSGGVHRRQYQVSFGRGLVASFIFFVTDGFYRFLKDRGDLYYMAVIALFVGATLVLVELIARWGSAEAERERRTEFLASIVSGLTFALIVQAGEHLIDRLRVFLG